MFGSDATGLTAAQLAEISFYSDAGTSLLGTGAIDSLGDVTVAIPEPDTVKLLILGTLVLMALGLSKRRTEGVSVTKL